ncbi:boophilin-H2 [Osmerus mordax]|uniref:boophilin-H2 n=1 Tax=Osmerus mordax TaxID=8014 RepID=UPI00350F3DCA
MAKIYFQLLLLGVTLCMNSAENPNCSKQMEEGTGEQSELQYFYDHSTGFCMPFFYKGQGGNDNRFHNDRDCMESCSSKYNDLYPAADAVCNLVVDQGSCFGMLLRYHYNQEEKNCRLFIYGGCQGNGNRFETREDCQSICMARAGRIGAGEIPNPDQATTDAGLIVGILGGVVFTVAVIASIVLVVKQKKEKDNRGKRQPVPDIEMN